MIQESEDGARPRTQWWGGEKEGGGIWMQPDGETTGLSVDEKTEA